MPVPPKEEEYCISEEIKKRMAVFQNLEIQASKGIAFLQERRTALIPAAVTGKIDVRNFVTPESVNIENSKEVTV